MIKFYDTSAIYKAYQVADEIEDEIWISSASLWEIEEWHRPIAKWLKDLDKQKKLKIILFREDFMQQKLKLMMSEHKISEYGSGLKHRVLSCAIKLDNDVFPDEVVYYTNSLEMKQMANLHFGNDSIIML